jgi:hypothetical protein
VQFFFLVFVFAIRNEGLQNLFVLTKLVGHGENQEQKLTLKFRRKKKISSSKNIYLLALF